MAMSRFETQKNSYQYSTYLPERQIRKENNPMGRSALGCPTAKWLGRPRGSEKGEAALVSAILSLGCTRAEKQTRASSRSPSQIIRLLMAISKILISKPISSPADYPKYNLWYPSKIGSLGHNRYHRYWDPNPRTA